MHRGPAPGGADGDTIARLWLRTRVDARITAAARELLRAAAEQLSIAVGDAVTVRVLSSDGAWLLGLAAHHPDGEIERAMVEAMRRSATPVTSGLWQPAINDGVAMSWDLTTRGTPSEASGAQLAFLGRTP